MSGRVPTLQRLESLARATGRGSGPESNLNDVLDFWEKLGHMRNRRMIEVNDAFKKMRDHPSIPLPYLPVLKHAGTGMWMDTSGILVTLFVRIYAFLSPVLLHDDDDFTRACASSVLPRTVYFFVVVFSPCSSAVGSAAGARTIGRHSALLVENYPAQASSESHSGYEASRPSFCRSDGRDPPLRERKARTEK